MSLFPPRDFQRDTYSILGSKFAYFVLESPDENILNKEGLKELKRLHQTVVKLKVKMVLNANLFSRQQKV